MPFPLLFHRLLTFGRRSEVAASDYLRTHGYRIVTTNYRTKNGEVDVVAWDGDVLAFVEVKARQNLDPPEDAVGWKKRQRLIRAAHAYIARHRLQHSEYRFDVLAVTALPGLPREFRLIRDAFRVDD